METCDFSASRFLLCLCTPSEMSDGNVVRTLRCHLSALAGDKCAVRPCLIVSVTEAVR